MLVFLPLSAHKTKTKLTMNKFQDIPNASFDFICRMCLMYSEVFPISDINWEDISLKSVIYTCSLIQVEENNRMPKNMCKVCIKKMYETYRFLTQCKNSNNILKGVLCKIVINTFEETNRFTEITTETKVEISNEAESEREAIDNQIEYLPNADNYDLKDPEEIKKENFEPEEDIYNDKNPNNELINTIRTLNNELGIKRSKSTLNREFICPCCQKRHDARYKLLEHLRTHSGEKPYKCPICRISFSCNSNLRRHMLVHSKVKPYNCQFCNKGFNRKPYLSDHERKHTGERLICPFCGEGFHSSINLWYHKKIHKGPPDSSRDGNPMGKDYQCHMCKKVLLNEHTLKNHMLVHGGKNFCCENCGKTYVSNNMLQRHIEVAHQGKNRDIRFPCSLCDKVYRQKGTLVMHMKSHTGENISYACEVCNKHFALKASLYKHRRIHTGDTRYQCKVCFHICTNKANLESHVRTHTGEKPFACMHCDKAFGQPSHLSEHIKIHTGEKNHSCRICGKGFYNGRSLRKHMTVHKKADEK